MTEFRVTYRRSKSAGAIQFDPDLEFTEMMEIPVQSSEDAIQHITREKPYIDVLKIEKINNEKTGDFIRTLNSYDLLSPDTRTSWLNQPQISEKISIVGGTISAFTTNYTNALFAIDALREKGVDEAHLIPLRKNIENMNKEAERKKVELKKILIDQDK